LTLSSPSFASCDKQNPVGEMVENFNKLKFDSLALEKQIISRANIKDNSFTNSFR
jgi:hypothetical protein